MSSLQVVPCFPAHSGYVATLGHKSCIFDACKNSYQGSGLSYHIANRRCLWLALFTHLHIYYCVRLPPAVLHVLYAELLLYAFRFSSVSNRLWMVSLRSCIPIYLSMCRTGKSRTYTCLPTFLIRPYTQQCSHSYLGFVCGT